MATRFQEYEIDDEYALLAWGRWEGRKKAVLNGKPGKEALSRFVKILESMQHKRLIAGYLTDGADVCANGALIYRTLVDEKGMTPKEAWKSVKAFGGRSDDEDYERLQRTVETAQEILGITKTLSELIAIENDEVLYSPGITPEDRYRHVLNWAKRKAEGVG